MTFPCRRAGAAVLCLLAAALLLASRALAVPGSSFLDEAAYGLVTPGSRRLGGMVRAFRGTGSRPAGRPGHRVWNPVGSLPAEQAVGVLAIVACTSWAARLLRAGARRADADADALSRRMAAQDAALAAEEAERRAASVVHDDVLSVLRAVSATDRPPPWSTVVAQAQGAQDALARQIPRGGYGSANFESALRCQASQAAPELVQPPPGVCEVLSGQAQVQRSVQADQLLDAVAAVQGGGGVGVIALGGPARFSGLTSHRR